MNAAQAVKNGVNIRTYRMRIKRGWTHDKAIQLKPIVEYVIYQGDNFIDIKTKEHIMSEYNMTNEQFKNRVTNSAPKRLDKQKSIHDRLIIQRLE